MRPRAATWLVSPSRVPALESGSSRWWEARSCRSATDCVPRGSRPCSTLKLRSSTARSDPSRSQLRSPRRLRSRLRGDGDELVALVATFLGLLQRGPDAAHIQLVVDRAGLERSRLLGEERVLGTRVGDAAEDPDHLEVILRLALVVLLPPRLADAWMGGHVDAGLRAVDAGHPGARRAPDVAARVELCGLLAEVPD